MLWIKTNTIKYTLYNILVYYNIINELRKIKSLIKIFIDIINHKWITLYICNHYSYEVLKSNIISRKYYY